MKYLITNVILLVLIMQTSCAQQNNKAQTSNKAQTEEVKQKQTEHKIVKQENVKKEKSKVTFIELGSVRCIPCRKMTPILESIRTKYPKDVTVIFHDVWTPEGKPYVQQFGINTIPTQVFLDENGDEYYRHVGFFPEKDVINVLKQKDVED